MSDTDDTQHTKSRTVWSDKTKPRWRGKALGKSRPTVELPTWEQAGAPGSLTQNLTTIIRRDARLRIPGSRPWKKAPTPEEADKNTKAAAKRLRCKAFAKVKGASSLSSIIASCRDTAPCGSHACFRCGQMDQRWLVSAMAPVLSKGDKRHRDWAFNFVMPEGQTNLNRLATAPFVMIMQRIRGALLDSPDVLFAAVAFDTSANDDKEKFRLGRLRKGRQLYFQVHVYGVVRTKNRAAVKRALTGLFDAAPNIYRPLWVSGEPFDGSAKGTSYILKPQGFRHIAYLNDEKHWKTRKPTPRLKPREQVYYLLAMHKLGLARRVGFVGLHPVVTKATSVAPATVILRRVTRAKSAR